jgi:hypothetical protein
MKTTRANTVEPSDAVNRCTAAHVTSHHNTLSSSYTRTMFKRQHVLVPNHRFLLSWPSEIGRSTSTSSHTSSRHIILSGPLFKGRTRRPVWPYRYPSNRTHRAHILVPLIKRDFHSQSEIATSAGVWVDLGRFTSFFDLTFTLGCRVVSDSISV